ncbi:MAG: RNA methyltransferase [Thermomicrobiales bacterium]|nr:RNA methyltransferase [Thermomicrobiales bacterium]
MSESARSSRAWLRRVRDLRDRRTREADGCCIVEGIRQVASAVETGQDVEALLVDPARLHSDVAWTAVNDAVERGARLVELTSRDMERISSRDNPIGLVAIVRWTPAPLSDLAIDADGIYLIADDIHDPGNLGTLVRATDSAGGKALIVLGGTDPAHPSAMRASLGTSFHLPIHAAASHDELFAWTAGRCRTVATSAHAPGELWDTNLHAPVAIIVGNEARGLSPETVSRCDVTVRIPMLGTATSLNVSVAAGVLLYEAVRQSRQ